MEIKLNGTMQYAAAQGEVRDGTAGVDAGGDRYLILGTHDSLVAWDCIPGHEPVPCRIVSAFPAPESDPVGETLGTFVASRNEALAALEEGHDASIVRCDGVCLTFQVTNPGRVVTQPSHASAARAMVFGHADAKRVAAEVTNARGIQAEAVHRTQALWDSIHDVDRLITLLSK